MSPKRKPPISSLYHTSSKKSIGKSKSALHPNKPVENRRNRAEKKLAFSTEVTPDFLTPQAAENSPKTCGKPVENSHKPVQKSKNPVEKSQTNPHQPSPAIKVSHLSKSFKLPTERAAGLKQAIFNWLKGVKGYTRQEVLRDLSFEVQKGEFLGIVGRNGSGKSTLLKLLANIYYPESGNIEINGTLVPFIELGVGFNPELTGRENVYLNGALLGFSTKEMDAMYDEIVRFAELEPFMDAKLKNYSSGMQVRLAFSIAIRAQGDILVLDEVLAVGDAAFQEKCNQYFASLHGNQTVILVTHSMENVRRFCDRAILIENGAIAADGKPDDIAEAYENLWK